MRCATCGSENPTTAKFCQECGTRLLEAPGTGERRQLTVMFSDLVGSTELSARFDPEEWRDIVVRYQRTAAEAISRFDGHVAQYQGDGIIVFFGYPQAHEDDAERAVRAGLTLLSDMDALNRRLEAEVGRRIAVRVGVHTGLVMVGAGGDAATMAFGDTVNFAARVQTAAEPNTLYIAASTQRLVAGFFLVEDRGRHALKGVPEPMQLYRVLQPSGVRGRLQAAAAGKLTPFIGREQERNLLLERWERAHKGEGQVVLITGEAGIGKSRLVQQFKDDLAGTPHTWAEGRAVFYEQHTPFAPTIDLLHQAFGWSPDTPVDERVDELERSFLLVGLDPTEAVPLMASLLGLAVPERYPPLLMSPEQQRRRLIATLVDWVFGSARLQPLVLVIEDLHWADASTLEELGLLAERCATAPVLLLFTARPRFRAPWPMQPYHAQVTLDRLDAQHVRDMIAALLAQLVPSAEIVETLGARTDGVPLFVEELTQAVVESGTDAAALRKIPSTLHDLLMARLDRLGSAKEVAQVGAVLGREFSYPLLCAIAKLPEVELQVALTQLIDAGLVYAQGRPPDATYLFKHVLVQDAAYGSLLKSRRRELHRSVAQAFSQQFGEIASARPELLAHHYTEAGEAGPAIEAWQSAGERAAARAAFVEAAQHYGNALEILNTLPDTPERAQQELVLQMPLGQLLQATKGFGSPEATHPYTRARQLAEQLGESPQFFFVLLGLWSSLNSRAELRAAQELADQMLRMAERDGATATLTMAHMIQGIQRYDQANWAAAREHMERAMSFYREEEHLWAPFNPKIMALMTETWALWRLGRADQARQKAREQFELAQQLPPGDLAMARATACYLYFYLREPDNVLEQAEALFQQAREHQLSSFLAWATMYRGWVWVEQGRPEEGVAQIRQGLGDFLAAGTRTSHRLWLGMLAEAYLKARAIAEGLAAIEDAFATTPEEVIYVSDLLRLRGDLLWKKAEGGQPSIDDWQSVEATYREAIDVARRQASRIQELRAATGLGRLLQSQGRSAEARALVAPLYAGFSEGLDSRDLREAKALLDEL